MNISSIGPAAPVSGPAEPAPARPLAPDQRELIQAIRAVNASQTFGDHREITFQVDSKTRRVITRIVNRDTGELIRQIPPELVMRLAEEINRP